MSLMLILFSIFAVKSEEECCRWEPEDDEAGSQCPGLWGRCCWTIWRLVKHHVQQGCQEGAELVRRQSHFIREQEGPEIFCCCRQ